MARVKHYRTCDDCGEEWPVSAKVARAAEDEGGFVCTMCDAQDAIAYGDLGSYGDYAIYGE